MDSAGRKPLLYISFGGQAVASLVGAVATWVDPRSVSEAAGLTQSVSLFLFMGVYGLGVGPIPCLYLSEIYPMDFKAFGMGMGAACNWAGIAIMTFVTLYAPNIVVFTLFFAFSSVAVLL